MALMVITHTFPDGRVKVNDKVEAQSYWTNTKLNAITWHLNHSVRLGLKKDWKIEMFVVKNGSLELYKKLECEKADQ